MVLKNTTTPDDALLAIADEMEAVTCAVTTEKPYGDVEYADSGYQEDGKKRYPLDTEIHIRAAWSYINQKDNQSLYSAANLAKVMAKIKAAMKRIGAEVADTSKSAEADHSIVGKIRSLLLGKDEVDMTAEELNTALDKRFEVLVPALVESLSKSVEAPTIEGAPATTEPPAVTTPETEPVEGLTVEDITKEIVAALAPYNEILEKVLDRLAGVEKATIARTSPVSQART